MQKMIKSEFQRGLKSGIPIGLGYLSVAFTFGMTAVSSGVPVWVAILISLTNVTSAGQFAGLSLIVSGASLIEMAMTQLIINLRYALMSLSLSQKLEKKIHTAQRCLIAFCNTDEIFAVASSQDGNLSKKFMYGLMIFPYLGWGLGTVLGAVASTLLPDIVGSALGIAIYGMFLAIIIPPAKKSHSVFIVILISATLSSLFRWTPGLNQVSSGFVIIICTLISAAIGALIFPRVEIQHQTDISGNRLEKE